MIVGTAGHIDHGKTALVKVLTGVDADRLAEEKARGISIELGFAYLPRADGSVIGFVDVPGHERFMKTMLAGATGIDFVLLVVAADDGVMPQTREHLAVVELLGLTRGAVAITKCDMVDAARVAAVEGAVRELLSHGPLADVPVFHTSATQGTGMGALLAHLDAAAAQEPAGNDAGAFRFAIDRSFSLPGAGTVVTGVVWAGELAVGDTVTASPGELTARVRALHVQGRPADRARRGERCGVNLGRVEAAALHRGDFLLDAALHAPAARIDAELHLLSSEARPLRHWTPVRLHHGAAEVAGRAALLQDEPLAPGATGLVQLVLDAPIAAAVMDRFVLRAADGSRTIGGGRLLDLRAPHRRRKQPRRLEQLAAMALGDPAASLTAQMLGWPWCVDAETFFRDRGLGPRCRAEVLAAAAPVVATGRAGQVLFAQPVWHQLARSALAAAAQFHRQFPQLLGPNAQRLSAALNPPLAKGAAQAVLEQLVADGALAREGGVYRLPGHRLGLDRADDVIWHKVQPLLAGQHCYRPMRTGPLAQTLALREFDLRRVLKAMSMQGQVIEIAPDHFFLRATMGEVAGIVRELAQAAPDGLFNAAQLRDRTDNGRKVAIQMLEYLDRLGLTLRRGDQRIIDPKRLEDYIAAHAAKAAPEASGTA
ncbi:MAG: selenocysteine-specific translation factor [Pseudomonadota bacterium]|jgi:selenocysteine-specific elongation factor